MTEYDEDHVPPAFARKYGDLRVPNSGDIQAWREGLLSGDRRDRTTRVDGSPVEIPKPYVPVGVHPVTGRWSPPWRKRPTGLGMVAQIRTRFKAGDPRTIRAASRSTPAKREAARRNGLLGGRPKKAKRPQAEG